MFDTILVRPIFNVLTFIYAVIPGHDFGLALIIFTIVMRFVVWPIARKQLHHTKAMRALQPEIKKIKQETKGDKQREGVLTMALYKERSINPFAPIGLMFLQLPILFALFAGINKIVKDPSTIISFSYGWVRDLSWMKEVAGYISL
ncbi:MAG: membrane protein insertase YidC, partial [Patescibacteria group bacterium]